MKSSVRSMLFMVASLLVSATFAQEPAAPIAQITLEDGDAIVFLGDSITHQCLYTQYVEDYFYTRLPDKRF